MSIVLHKDGTATGMTPGMLYILPHIHTLMSKSKILFLKYNPHDSSHTDNITGTTMSITGEEFHSLSANATTGMYTEDGLQYQSTKITMDFDNLAVITNDNRVYPFSDVILQTTLISGDNRFTKYEGVNLLDEYLKYNTLPFDQDILPLHYQFYSILNHKDVEFRKLMKLSLEYVNDNLHTLTPLGFKCSVDIKCEDHDITFYPSKSPICIDLVYSLMGKLQWELNSIDMTQFSPDVVRMAVKVLYWDVLPTSTELLTLDGFQDGILNAIAEVLDYLSIDMYSRLFLDLTSASEYIKLLH